MDDSTRLLVRTRNPLNFLLFLLFPLCLFNAVLTPTHAQQIYKWADENGTVHYSDRPDPNAQTEQILIKPGPDSGADETPDEAIKRLQATSNELEASRQQRETARAKEQEKHRKALEENAKQEIETDKRESNRDRWYYGRYPQRPPIQPSIRPPVKPQPPLAVPLPSNVPAGNQ